jgi:diguanylate cyclase (GGDEF)-like protein
MRRYARLITVPRFAGAIALGLGAAFNPGVVVKPLAFAGALALVVTNVAILALPRFHDKHAQRAIAYSIAADFLVVTSLQLNIIDGSSPVAYLGLMLVGIESGLLFRVRGLVAFTGVFAILGWVPYAQRQWLGHQMIFIIWVMEISCVLIATWIVALIAQESEQRRGEAAYLARLNEALSHIAQQIMGNPEREDVVGALTETLQELDLPWSFGVFVQQEDGTLRGPRGTIVDAKNARESWAGTESFVPRPDFLSEEVVASFCEHDQAEDHDSVLIRCQTNGDLVAALLVVSDKKDTFSENEMEFFATLCYQTCAALDRAVLHEHVKELSLTDALTQLRNRRAFEQRLAEEISRSDRSGMPLAMLMIDIDHFKILNDTQGHVAGDRTLTQIGETIQSPALMGDINLAYRLGGEEFGVLMPGTEMDGAVAFADRLRNAVGETDFPDAKEQPLGHLTVSVGVAMHYAGSGDSGKALIEATDLALYEAKRSGRDCVRSAPVLRAVEDSTSVAG